MLKQRQKLVLGVVMLLGAIILTASATAAGRADYKSKSSNQSKPAAKPAPQPRQTQKAAAPRTQSAPARSTQPTQSRSTPAPAARTQSAPVRRNNPTVSSVSRSSSSRSSTATPSRSTSNVQVQSRSSQSVTPSRPVNRSVSSVSTAKMNRSAKSSGRAAYSRGTATNRSASPSITSSRSVVNKVTSAPSQPSNRTASVAVGRAQFSKSKSNQPTASQGNSANRSSTPGSSNSASRSNASSVSRTITPRSTASNARTRGNSTASTSRAGSNTTFDVYGTNSSRSQSQAQTRTTSNKDRTANTDSRVSRITVDDIDTEPERIIVSERSKSSTARDRRTTTSTSSRNVTRDAAAGRTEPQSTPSTRNDAVGRARYVKDKTPESRTENVTSNTINNTTRVGRSADGARSRDRSGDSRTVNINNTTINNTTRVERSSLGGRSRDRDRVRIDVDINNTVVVSGRPTRSHVRPHVSCRLYDDISYVYHQPRWHNHSGFYFSFTWSSNTCGRVVYLPYTYGHTWYRPGAHYRRPYYGMSYYYPRYHRKYVFVSLGGYWPDSYRYRRYYWYGCHPYYWYGSTIINEPTRYVTYNTYNTYTYGSDYSSGFSSSSTPYYTLGQPKEEIIDEPQYQSPADLSFDNGVKLFGAGNYEDAARQFREAVILAPEDVVLPFTYSQALFADGQYALAASVLRGAISNISDDELTIYYPRGLYPEDAQLEKQVKELQKAIIFEPFSSDYQLLLGYQHLGMGDLDKARGPLSIAAQSPANRRTAEKLLDLAAKLELESLQAN